MKIPMLKKRYLLGFLFLITVVIGFILLWLRVSHYDDMGEPEEKRQAAIVLGAALWNDEPSPALRERLDLAYSLYQAGKVEWIICSGGIGDDSSISEAEGMRRYLLRLGVSDDRIILEDHSHSTKANLANSKELLDQRALTDVYLVTHDYHLYRALYYAAQSGISAKPAPVHSQVLFIPYYKLRECFALIKLFLLG